MLLDKNGFKNLLLFLVAIVVCFLIAEMGVRMIYKDSLGIREDERNLTYRHDSNLGWFPQENSIKQFTGSRLIEVKHNSRGFRDDEHTVGDNPRIVFLGDSFVWGYDVNQPERFTDKLQKMMSNWSVYNLGVSGYGTDQEYLLLQKHYDFYKPDIVFLVFCTENDWDDNSQSRRYGGYYKPYFFIKGGELELNGIPVPKMENYFFIEHDILARSYLVRLIAFSLFNFLNPQGIAFDNPTYMIIDKMVEMSKDKGFHFIVGIQGTGPALHDFLEDRKIPYLNLANPYRYRLHGGHWTPEGHTFVARKIYDYLQNNKYLETKAAADQKK